jgi:hypothetical protein
MWMGHLQFNKVGFKQFLDPTMQSVMILNIGMMTLLLFLYVNIVCYFVMMMSEERSSWIFAAQQMSMSAPDRWCSWCS